MVKQIHYLEDLKTNNSNVDKIRWNIAVRVLRLWRTPSLHQPGEIHSIDMILIDEKGSKIQGSITKKKAFYRADHILEGSTYNISNFAVYEYNPNLRCCKFTHRIMFFENAYFKRIEQPSIPLRGFEFLELDSIQNYDVSGSHMIDVIGVIKVVGPMDTNASGYGDEPHQRRSILITNSRFDDTKCVLWDSYAEQLSPYESVSLKDKVVIIIQFAKIENFAGKNYISNYICASVVFVDDIKIPEIVQYKQSFILPDKEADYDDFLKLESQPTHSLEDQFLKETERKTCVELHDLRIAKQLGTFVTIATIEGIEDEFGWYYNSCLKCKKKAIHEGQSFRCLTCDKEVKYPAPRFRVVLRVADKTGSNLFTLFGNEVFQVIQKTIKAVLESIPKETDINEIPADFKVILKKEFLFIVAINEKTITNEKGGLNIVKLSDDPSLILKYKEAEDANQENSMEDHFSESDEQPKSSKRRRRNTIVVSDDDSEDLQNEHCEGNEEVSTTERQVKVKIEKLD